ncbi:MAG: glycosyltransferase family 39 protein [Candidatus ainarchaeum sp.]|nr:glycosyltransferase family 39 protein [Candidatus ainarchaeum sp.]
MALLALLGLVCLLALPGMPFAFAILKRDDSIARKIALGAQLSLGFNTLLLFLVGVLLAGMTWLFIPLYLIASAIGVRLASQGGFAFKFPPLRFPVPEWQHLAALFCIAVIALEFYYSAFFPFYSWDAIASYNRWASAIFESGGAQLFQPYPELVPIAYAFPYFAAGAVAQNYAHALSWVAGTLALFYAYETAKKFSANGWLAVFLALAIPEFIYLYNSGYADTFMAAFVSSGAYYALESLEGKGGKPALISGALFGLAAFSKPQGLFLLFIVPSAYAAAWAYSKWRKLASGAPASCALSLASFAAVASPWYAAAVALAPGFFSRQLSLSQLGTDAGASLPGLPGNPLFRPAFVVQNFAEAYKYDVQWWLAALLLCGFLAFAAGELARKRQPSPAKLFAAAFAALSLAFWIGFMSFEFRQFAFALPLFASLGAAGIACAASKLAGPSRIALFAAVGALLLFTVPFTLHAASTGKTIGLVRFDPAWGLGNAFASDDEKLLHSLGDVYDMTMYIRANALDGRDTLVSDPRMLSMLDMKTRYAGAAQAGSEELAGLRYVVIGSRAGLSPELSAALNRSSTKLVYSAGPYQLFELNSTG